MGSQVCIVLHVHVNACTITLSTNWKIIVIPPLPEGGGGYTVLPLSVQDIFRRIFLSNYWWQRSDIWSQASYRCPILWEAFFDPSDSYFLFAEERRYHKWALAHSSSCFTKKSVNFLRQDCLESNSSVFLFKVAISITKENIFENCKDFLLKLNKKNQQFCSFNTKN